MILNIHCFCLLILPLLIIRPSFLGWNPCGTFSVHVVWGADPTPDQVLAHREAKSDSQVSILGDQVARGLLIQRDFEEKQG